MDAERDRVTASQQTTERERERERDYWGRGPLFYTQVGLGLWKASAVNEEED